MYLLREKVLCLVITVFLMAAPITIWAEESWKSDLEIGYIQTSGNTEVESMNAKGKSIYTAKPWRTTLEGSAMKVSDNMATTAEKYDLSLQEDRKFGNSSYMYARLSYVEDRFAGVANRTSETIGYGFDIFELEYMQWNAEIGAGFRQIKSTAGVKTRDDVGRLSTSFNWKISQTAKFYQLVKTEGGEDGFVTNSETSLLNQINGHLSSKISFSAQHTSEVPAGTNNWSKETAVSLVFSY